VRIRHHDRVITARHHDDIMIFDGHRFVEIALGGIDALERKSLRWMQSMIVDFLERAFRRQVVSVVLVRWIAGSMAAGRPYLDHQQALGGLALRKDIADVTRVRALAPRR